MVAAQGAKAAVKLSARCRRTTRMTSFTMECVDHVTNRNITERLYNVPGFKTKGQAKYESSDETHRDFNSGPFG
eukprot:52752-Eustigmatos_ZCMA.PRE.1